MRRIVLLIILFSIGIQYSSFAQVWAVNSFVSDIEDAVAEVNTKARAKDLSGALSGLDKLNDYIRRNEHRFSDWYEKAREEDPGFSLEINDAGLVEQLQLEYWRSMLVKVNRNKRLVTEAFEGIRYDEALDDQDVAWSYLQTIYKTGKSLIAIAESYKEGSVLGVFFNTKEGLDQFVDDYAKILSSENQRLETEAKEANLKRMLSKAKLMERNYLAIEKKMNNSLAITKGFVEKIETLKQIAKGLNKSPRFKIDPTDSRYNFYGSKYLQEIVAEAARFKEGYIQWENFENSFNNSIAKAFREKQNVLGEIRESDDVAVKAAKKDEVNDVYNTFKNDANRQYHDLKKTYNQAGDAVEINLNYRLSGFEPAQYPSGQTSNSGSSGSEIRLSAVKAEADVQDLVNHIHLGVREVNQLANQRQMKAAIDRLTALNRRIDNELSFSFGKDYRTAREENPNFKIQVNAQLSGQFKAAYWESSMKKNASLLIELTNKYYNPTKSNAGMYWKSSYAICKSIYDILQVKPNVEKELKEKGKQEAWNKFEESVDGLKDDIKKIKKAIEIGYNTPETKANIGALMKKVRIAASYLENMASYMRANEEEASRFYSLIDRLNKIKKEIESGPRKLVDNFSDSRYNFNESDFYGELKVLVSDYKEEEIYWNQFDQNFNALIKKAEYSKYQVIENIKGTDDFEEKKQQAIKTETKDWDGFDTYAKRKRDDLYDLKDQSTSSNNSNTTENQLFAGSKVSSGIVASDTEDENKITKENSESNKPSGKRIKNTFYHNIWGDKGGNSKLYFHQNGSSVMMENPSRSGSKKGNIINGVLTFNFRNSNNDTYKVEYKLVGDGYKMEVRKEMTDRMISDKLLISNNFTAPKQKEIEEYRAKNGSVEISELIYKGSFFAMTNDSDHDAVRDDFDNCLNTSEGLTVENGGVNIMGCLTGLSGFSVSGKDSDSKGISKSSFSGSSKNSSDANKTKVESKKEISAGGSNKKISNRRKQDLERVLVGKISNDGDGKGEYRSLAIENISLDDMFEFKLLSGEIYNIQVIWRDKTGSWETKYNGKETSFEASDFIENTSASVTHLNFVVNSNHNFWKKGSVPCEMEVWHLKSNDQDAPSHQQDFAQMREEETANKQGNTTNKTDTKVVKDNPWAKKKTSISTEKKVVEEKPIVKSNSKVAAEFSALLKKADESFNKKYWNEEQGPRSSSNPKQESINLLRRAEQLIGQEKHILARYDLVYKLVSTYSGYAKRVSANSAKVDFIKLAAGLANKYGGSASSISKEFNGMSAAKTKSMAYTKIASSWRVLAQAAMWGKGEYNRMYCDKETKRYYQMALSNDPTNTQLKKIVEDINAPKKARR